jgi:hypothetical protein
MDWRLPLLCALVVVSAAGCHSPYASDRMAGAGALLGAGTGAIIGSHGGHAAEGALIGAAVGTAAGAVTGSAIDNAEARNRAAIEARMGYPVRAGAVSVNDIIAMTRAGVPDDVIASHIETRGMAHAVTTGDLIRMQSEGVRPMVMAAAQRPPGPVVVRPAPPPGVIVAGPPCCYPPPYYYRPRVGFGFSYHHHH